MQTLRIKEIRKETEDTVSIVVDVPADLKENFQYTSGQYLTFEADINDEKVRRS